MTKIPFLVEQDAVRSEASDQWGGLSDAAAFHQAWRASIDPNLEATALKQINEEETKKVRASLNDDGKDSFVYGKISDHLNDSDHGLTVLDAVVRGHALSLVVETDTGRIGKIVVPYDDKFVSVGISAAEAASRRQAMETVDLAKMGREMQAEVERRVAAQREEILAQIRGEMGLASPAAEPGDGAGEGEKSEGGDGSEVKWPHTHDDLDALAAANGVTFEANAKVDDKIEALQAAGVKPS